jgi:hypothetical protein
MPPKKGGKKKKKKSKKKAKNEFVALIYNIPEYEVFFFKFKIIRILNW